jgi:hypothetical protein
LAITPRILRSVAGCRAGWALSQVSHHSLTGLSPAAGSDQTPDRRLSTWRRSHSWASRFRGNVRDAT